MLTYDIFDNVFQLRNVLDSFFDETARNYRGREYPFIQRFEGEDEMLFRVLVPGVTRENINIELVDTSLVIEGEKKEDHSDNPYLRRERMFGKFRKSIKLPYRVDPEKITADMKDGILEIHLVKSEDAKPKKIEIR